MVLAYSMPSAHLQERFMDFFSVLKVKTASKSALNFLRREPGQNYVKCGGPYAADAQPLLGNTAAPSQC